MKFSWKTIVIGFGGLVGVLVLAAVLFIVFFPKELAAREAERRIEAATGRELVLGDQIDVTFWPALGFSVNDAALSNPEGFPQDAPFIAAEKIVFAVALMPLRRGAQVFGLFALGSEETERFYAGMGTLYLGRIGELVSVALLRQLG